EAAAISPGNRTTTALGTGAARSRRRVPVRSMFTTRTGVKRRVARAWPALVPALVAAACDTMAPGDPGNLVPATVAENAALPAISMNGALFHVETFGDPSNPVIVFLHGGPGGDYRSMLRL